MYSFLNARYANSVAICYAILRPSSRLYGIYIVAETLFQLYMCTIYFTHHVFQRFNIHFWFYRNDKQFMNAWWKNEKVTDIFYNFKGCSICLLMTLTLVWFSNHLEWNLVVFFIRTIISMIVYSLQVTYHVTLCTPFSLEFKFHGCYS